MGGFKKQQFEPSPVASMEDVADALGGDVDGNCIMCPSPGRPASDRTMCVRLDPSRTHAVYVYYCEGPLGGAYAWIRSVLSLKAPPPNPRATEYAERIWSEAHPAAGTIVEKYLVERGIKLAPPDTLRFHPSLRHETGGYWPAMVGGVVGANGSLCAVHRTYLRFDGRSKAPVTPQKMTLGPIGGLAVRLSGAAAKVVVAEGIETTLSVMQEKGMAGFAALSAVGMRALILPPEVRHVLIAADGDEAGRHAARAAMKRFLREGRTVTVDQAPDGLDFNDLLRARGQS